MSKKLFVGGISWNTSDADLSQAFGQFGEIVEATVVTDRETGRSRGFGFVVFADDADADKAMSAMNGSELDGRTIRVDEAHDRKPRREFGGGGAGRGGGGGRW
jgi:RNA recognition motif-containing protein